MWDLRVLGREKHELSASLVSSCGCRKPVFSVWRMWTCGCVEVVFGTIIRVNEATRGQGQRAVSRGWGQEDGGRRGACEGDRE